MKTREQLFILDATQKEQKIIAKINQLLGDQAHTDLLLHNIMISKNIMEKQLTKLEKEQSQIRKLLMNRM